jgi:hypothetical protein
VFTADMIRKYMVSYLLEYENGLKSFSSSWKRMKNGRYLSETKK